MLRSTHHGPVFWEDRNRHVAYSARLAGLETGNLPELVPHLFNARRIADLEKVYDAGHFFKWHRIVIDRHGHMAYYFHAATHQRDDRFDWNAPVDGSIRETEWGEPISWRDMPHLRDPSCGFLVNCDNSPYTVTPKLELSPSQFPRHLTRGTVVLAPTTRAYRAMELIQAKPQLDFGDLELPIPGAGMARPFCLVLPPLCNCRVRVM